MIRRERDEWLFLSHCGENILWATGLVRPEYYFHPYRMRDDFNHAARRAIGLWYRYPEKFRRLMVNGLRYDFSWSRPGMDYINIYDDIRHK